MNLLHPPIWLYSGFSVAVLCGMWIGRCILEGRAEYEAMLPKSEITRLDIGLPTSPWKPILFTDLAMRRSADVIFQKGNSGIIAIYRKRLDAKGYRKVQELALNVERIESIIAVDYSRIGYNDLIVSHSTQTGVFHLAIMKNTNGLFSSGLTSLNQTSLVLPLAFDFEQNGFQDVLFQDPSTRQFKLLRSELSFPDHLAITPGDFTKSGVIELLIESSPGVYKILQNFNNFWQPVLSFRGPASSGPIVSGDFDGDGFLDIVVPVREGVCIMFNAEHGFIDDATCDSSLFVPVENMKQGHRPQVGDLTLSGVPDLGIATEHGGVSRTLVLLNQPSVSYIGRGIVFTKRAEVDGEGGFIDLMEDGRLDLLTDHGSFVSTLGDEAFFLKVVALNGLCLDSCSSGKRYPNPAPLSTIEHGAIISLLFTDSRGIQRNRTAVQALGPGLVPPYVIFGLGDNAHYVNEVLVMSGGKNDTWTWILPNSYVFTSNDHQGRVYLMFEIRAFWVLFGTVALLLGIGMLALMFARQEDEEDRKEAGEILPLF